MEDWWQEETEEIDNFFQFLVERHFEAGAELASYDSLAGGDINQVARLFVALPEEEAKPQIVVVKWNSHLDLQADFFEVEEANLILLAGAGAQVPPVLFTGTYLSQKGKFPYLVMEYLQPLRASQSDRAIFQAGCMLATMHYNSQGSRFGLDYDNYLGTLPQANQWNDSGVAFVISQRLKPLAGKALLDEVIDLPLYKKVEQLCAALESHPDRYLPMSERPCLLHGDLHAGNLYFTASLATEAVLIDPACSYGYREMDIAMLKLFGGIDDILFVQGYESVWPLAHGWEDRVAFFQLYHILAHILLFPNQRSYQQLLAHHLEALLSDK